MPGTHNKKTPAMPSNKILLAATIAMLIWLAAYFRPEIGF
jgi:hypothetical protein